MSEANKSNSPILFSGISETYLKAFQIIWSNEFKDKHHFYWDKALIFHPITQLLGLALETSMKGLLISKMGSIVKDDIASLDNQLRLIAPF